MLPICQDGCQWTCRRDGCRYPPPTFTGSSRTDLKQTSNSSLGREWYRVTNKPLPLLQCPTGPKVPNSKEYTQTGGKGAPRTHTPLLTQSRAPCSFRGQFPSLNRNRKPPVCKAWGGAGLVPETSKFGSCWKRPIDLPGNSCTPPYLPSGTLLLALGRQGGAGGLGT